MLLLIRGNRKGVRIINDKGICGTQEKEIKVCKVAGDRCFIADR